MADIHKLDSVDARAQKERLKKPTNGSAGELICPDGRRRERGFLPKTERKSLILKGPVIARTAVYFYSKITRK